MDRFISSDSHNTTNDPRNYQLLLKDKNKFTTHEVRRAYKLCHDPKIPNEIRKIAQQTFKFVHVATQVISTKEEYTLDSVFRLLPAPWEVDNSGYPVVPRNSWMGKEELSLRQQPDFVTDRSQWREQLIAHYTYASSFPPLSPSVSGQARK